MYEHTCKKLLIRGLVHDVHSFVLRSFWSMKNHIASAILLFSGTVRYITEQPLHASSSYGAFEIFVEWIMQTINVKLLHIPWSTINQYALPNEKLSSKVVSRTENYEPFTRGSKRCCACEVLALYIQLFYWMGR